MQAIATNYHALYWEVSAAFNGTGKEMQTGEALNKLRDIIEHTGPMNPLHSMAVELREQIIHMDKPSKTRKQNSTTTTVLAFAPVQKKTKKPIKDMTDGQVDRTVE